MDFTEGEEMPSPSKGLQLDGREMPPEPNDNMEKSEETEQIRREMHLAISKRDLDQVQKYLDEAKYLRQWLNPEDGESALCSAVRQGAFRICGLLRCYNCIPSKENKKEESKTFTTVGNIEELEYRYQLFRYARESLNSSYLIPKSDSIGSCGETKLPELYQKLNEIPYVKTILQVVATSPYIQIMFDFNNEDLECTLWYQDNRDTWGMTFFEQHEIHIGAKRKQNELLGTLAHELCHYALQLVYENEAKPYIRGDKSTKALYVDILKEIQDKKESVHDVIKRAFRKDSVREEELVVRVPHLLAMHSEQILQEQVPKLLQFFKNNVINDMNDFLKKSFGQRDREAIKEQNARLGKAERTEKLGITFRTEYKLKENALLVLTAPNMTFLEVMINDAVRSTGESYVFLDTVQWDKELKDAMRDNKCYYVILSSDPEFDLEENRRAMLELLVELSRVRETKVILLTKDRRQDDFVKDMMDQEYFMDKAEVACVSHAQFDGVTDECKEKVLRSSRICFQRKRNARISEDDVKVFCKALGEDTFLQLCRTKEIRVTVEQPSENENDGSCYVERKCARVMQVDLKEALRHERKEAFAIVGSSRKKVRELDPTNIDVCHYSEVKKFRKCVLLDNVGQYETLKESPFYKDKTIHLIQYKGENTEKEREEKNRTDTDRFHAKPTRAAPPCSSEGGSTGYQWVRSNGPVSHLPMVYGGTRQILNEKALRGIIAEKVVAILGAPGMGKSLLSSRVAQDINNDEKNWVLHVNLMGKTGFLNLSASLDDPHHAVEQLAKLCDVKAGTFDFSLLQHSIQNARPFKVVVIFDEFDEVDVKCRQLVMKLVRALSATQISKLFLFSRTLCKSEIEDTFHTIAFELIGFDEQQQLEFLKKYWKRNDLEMDDAKFHSFAQRTLSGFRASGKDSVIENPLLLRMIAEIEEEQLNQLELGTPEDKTVLTGAKRELLDVYEKFVANKFRIYREKLVGKRDSNESALAVQYDAAVSEHHFYKSYGLLALKVILHQELITKLLEESTLRKLEKGRGLMKDVQEGRLKHGFLDECSGETPVFLHKTFAEFFAARFLAHKINSATSTDDVVYDVVAHMYGTEEYSGVLDFFDAMGTKSHSLHRYIMDNDSKSVKNSIKEWRSVDEFGRMPLHVAALHADQEILNIFSSELGDKLAEELREKDVFGMTPLMYVDRIRAWKRLDVLCTRCTDENMKWVKQLRAVNEIITKERRFEQSVFSEAVIVECSELLHCFNKAWYSRKNMDANVVEMPINIGGALLRCSDIQAVSASGLSLFHVSASLGLVEICRHLTFRLSADAHDKYGETPLQEAAIYGRPNVVHILLPHSTAKTATDKNDSTPLHAVPKFHGLFELRTLYLRALDRANDRRWWTSSHETALKGHDVVLSLILPHVDGTIRNRSGESALHESVRNLFWRSIVLLLPYSDVDSVNHSCETPMLRSVSDNSLLRNLRTTSVLKESVECSKEVRRQSIASVKLFILHSDVTVAAKEDRVALHQCVSAGHQDVMRLLLPLSSVSALDKNGLSTLHYAAKSGNVECFKFLLPLSSVNALDGNGITALHMSASLGHADITRLLLLFASTEFPDEEKPTPLHYSTFYGHSNVVEHHLPHSSTSCTDSTGSTLLHLSAKEGHFEVARVILPHSDPLLRNIDGDTALHLGAYYRYYKVLKLVFPYSEADTQNNSGSVALVDSLWGYIKCLNEQGVSDKSSSKRTDMLVRDDIETIKLLSLHSDVNVPDNYGRTALHASNFIGRMDITKLILPLSSISALDKRGNSSLRYAAEIGNVDCFKLLLPLSSVNALDSNGITALHVSAGFGHADITRLLLLFASTEFPDEEEPTPLYYSTLTGHSDVVEHLLPHSSTSCTDSTGRTSLHLSAKKGHLEVARVILPHSDPLIRDTDGDTALHLGAYYRYYKVLKLVFPYSEADTQNNSGSVALVDSLWGYIKCLNEQGVSDKSSSKRTDMLVRDDIETIKLLSLHSDVNIPDNGGRTALHVSTSIGRMDITKLILPPSSISALDKNGISTLHYAAKSGNVDCFKLLLPLSSVNALDGNGITAFHVSAGFGRADITRLLLLFASTEFPDEEEPTLLYYSILNGHSGVVEHLLPHSSTSCTDSTGSISLHLSAKEGHLEVARVILPHSDPLIHSIEGDTALHVGAYYRYYKVLKLVFPYSEADTQNNSDSIALVHSLSGYIEWLNQQGKSDKGSSKRTDMLVREHIETIKLLSLHSDVNIPDNDGRTALHVITSIGRMDITKLILPLSSVSGLDKNGFSSLRYAAEIGNVGCFKLLMPLSSVNAPDAVGKTALHVSAYRNNIDITTVLLPLVSIRVRDKYDNNPLRTCTCEGHTHIADLLIPHSSTTTTGRAGCNPMHGSAEFGHVEIVRLFLPHTDALVRDYDGDTALHCGAYGRCSLGVKLLLPYCGVEMTNNSGRTALLEYLRECIKIWKKQQESTADGSEESLVPEADDVRMIKMLVLHSAVDITIEDDGATLQMSSCAMPSGSVHAMVPSNREDASGETFLHYSVLRGKLNLTRYQLPDSSLHRHGHDGELLEELRILFDAVDTLKSVGRLTWTSDACKYILLHYCVTKGNARMTELVLPHSSTSGNNRSGCTALQLSSYNGREQILRVILPHSDVMFHNYNGETAVHVGAHRHCYDVVTLLFPYSDVNIADKLGGTILVRSLRGCSRWFESEEKNTTETWEKNKMMGKEDIKVLSIRMMKLLVLHSDLDIVDEDDRTALQVCESLRLLDVKKLLLPHFDSSFPRLHHAITRFQSC